MASPICPFTLATMKPEDVGMVYETIPRSSSVLTHDSTGGPENPSNQPSIRCGLPCTLTHLVSYLHDNNGFNRSKPLSLTSAAPVVCDAASSDFLSQQNGKTHCSENEKDQNEGRIIAFRYGNVSYFLWVYSERPSSNLNVFGHRRGNALDRIAYVLGMDVKDGLKVIYKGKILFPESKATREGTDAISERMLEISSSDLIHRRKKPSLVVMGLRKPITSAAGNQGITFVISAVTGITTWLAPWYICNCIKQGFRFIFRTAASLFGGTVLFLRSILQPPDEIQR